ncbi:penicillin-binding transpeptidase domain-containing protein [Sporolactobacillus terrae]|uniref:Penicillin-binding protein n=1 Tax=Sporolactobacillus terrae TaxID=269673 RepID=A0A410DCA1_9BACL|nr:penicillin-binding transpeptidase domain-containing protein [Sporolactobacillus terrae]QAA23736.1 penicillin-binding transpeptidase domain-containing protein [Sporolactobacillus terrae]QAA26708.1 penicillin-binding transpeptidase domain-containing protein [Sporolactobacillus terrae]UAK15773.1 penicillin-binding transpeptidase domain-containing protein [Sporolactobacillus terrae]BBO00270.1 penicillin-binding protein [Sporolactobacillus terrae]
MKQRKLIFLFSVFLVLLFVLSACGQKPTAKDRMEEYVHAWQKQDFSKMYTLLSKSSQKRVSKADFIERYKRIYGNIEAGKLTARVQENKSKSDSVHVTATLATVAGPIKFSQNVAFKEEKQKDEKNLYLDWQPNLILPKMNAQSSVRVDTLPSTRGEIADRNGKPLAINGTAARIDLVPGKMGSDNDKTATIKQLTKLLGVSKEQIDQALSASWVKVDSLVPITTVDAAKTDLIKKAVALPGVVKTDVSSRVYPDKNASAHLTGYVGKMTAELLKQHKNEGYTANSVIGKTGLELLFEKQLRQHNGAEIKLLDSTGAEVATLAKKDPVDGHNVQLTIDRDVQDSLYDQLKKDAGTAVAIDPRNGDILGLVSAPSYNPNDFVLGISSSEYQKLSNDQQQPLRNRFTAASAPGSTFKPLTAALALTHKAINPDTKVAINGSKWQASSSWGDYYVTRVNHDAKVNLETALFKSDNIYFAQTALKIGGTAFASDAKKFGFGESLPIEFPMRKSTISNSGKLNDQGLLANTGYGQGQVSVTPLHLSLIYSALVNDGSMIKPRLVKTNDAPTFWKKNVMSADTAQLLNKDLIQVVANPSGTAHDAQINGITLAGKTGTPEFKQKQGESGRENGWFTAYNTDDPKLLVTMIVENTQKKGGSHYVTPKVKKVFEQVLKK